MAHNIMVMEDLQWEQMLTWTIVNEKAYKAAVKVLAKKADNEVLRVQGYEVKPHEGCDKFQHRDKKNGFIRKMVEDRTPVCSGMRSSH